MTALQLYKFINKEEGIEWDWRECNGQEDVVIWIPFYKIEEFVEMLSESAFAERSITVFLQSDMIAVDMRQLCERHDIDIEDVFKKTS